MCAAERHLKVMLVSNRVTPALRFTLAKAYYNAKWGEEGDLDFKAHLYDKVWLQLVSLTVALTCCS